MVNNYYNEGSLYGGWGNVGWICPKCGRVYSPMTTTCAFCTGNEGIKITCGINTSPNTTGSPIPKTGVTTSINTTTTTTAKSNDGCSGKCGNGCKCKDSYTPLKMIEGEYPITLDGLLGELGIVESSERDKEQERILKNDLDDLLKMLGIRQ